MIAPIFINGKFLTSPVTGVQRYALELLCAMDTILGEPEYRKLQIVCLAPPKTQTAPAWKRIELRRVGVNPGNLWEQLDLPMIARGRLIFSPANTGPAFYSNQVITLHDAAVFGVPQAYSSLFRIKYALLFNAIVRTARLILTVSSFSQRELSRYLRVPAERFTVIASGGDHLDGTLPDPSILIKHALTRHSYLLSVASQSVHKNFGRVLQAADLIEADLEFAAAGGSYQQIFQKTEESAEHPNVRLLGYVSDAELKALYENALGFIFPSIYEGFGLPVLEAMNCGCPVLCSNAASLPEVGGEAVLYFNPLSVDEMAMAIRKFLDEPGLRADLQARGRVQASRFRWESTARQVLARLLACSLKGNQ
ncbi:MAG: glycosyltransferase family 1 protein [Chloroflexi bacterium]|nr:glycosyltransferase family 1 protein [Chloroflexota bacterium]